MQKQDNITNYTEKTHIIETDPEVTEMMALSTSLSNSNCQYAQGYDREIGKQ